MSHTIEVTNNNLETVSSPEILKRLAVLVYGIFGYTVGVAGLLWIILAMGGLAPVGLVSLQPESTFFGVVANLVLIVLFGLQHSVMARSGFKSWLARFAPKAVERSTFVLFSGIFMIAAICFWQPIPGTVWAVENSVAQLAIWTVYALGWGYLFAATFVTNHFELMGLRQVYLYFTRQPYSTLPFTRKYMYSYSRHPMMLGVLVGMWAVPTMSVSHLIMSALLTVYIAVGLILEERDLVKQFGETYKKYRKEISTLMPGF